MKKLSKVCLYSLLGPEFSISSHRMSLYLLVQGGTFHIGDLFPDFRGTEESPRAPPAPAAPQVTLFEIINIPIMGRPGLGPNIALPEGKLFTNGFNWIDSQRCSPERATKKSIPNEALPCWKEHRKLKSCYSELLTSSQSTELLKWGTCFQPQDSKWFWFRSVLAFTSTLLRRKEKQNMEVTIC